MSLERAPSHPYTNNELCAYLRSRSVVVLYPEIETDDENIKYYYDFSQSLEEYTRAFAHLEVPWVWQGISLQNLDAVLLGIAELPNAFVINLCDGDEVNGAPGISVLCALEQYNILYTGAHENFFHLTTSKIVMKKEFDTHNVPNAAWCQLDENSIQNIPQHLTYPLIVKPAVSGGSMGVGVNSVVDTHAQLTEQYNLVLQGYRGWNLTVDGVLAEEYIAGREFTCFIVGNYTQPDLVQQYHPVERVFHHSLSEKEKFLSFDRLWETYENEQAMPNNEFFYTYHEPERALWQQIQQTSWDAYCAVQGTGFGRVDLRYNGNKLYVLEVNAQCGISEDEDFTSIGAILRYSKVSFAQMILDIVRAALQLNAE
ncbi:MAG: hypothetical protein JNJ85_10145 [Candidatus Kapabacteria bacterium]|nr:hypothetical protein [Candidatus Kapabacteria bacterium]